MRLTKYQRRLLRSAAEELETQINEPHRGRTGVCAALGYVRRTTRHLLIEQLAYALGEDRPFGFFNRLEKPWHEHGTLERLMLITYALETSK